MNRTLNVVRMQLINRQTYLWVPLLILGGAFVLSLAIYAILWNAGVAGPKYGGGIQAPLWYFTAVGVQALTLSFPFSQAMSVTRREFYLGTLATAALSAITQALVVVIGGLIEQATNGWGMNGYFFQLPWLWEGGPLGAGVVFFTSAMLLFIVGFWAATIYKRFGVFAVTSTLVGLGVVLVAISWLLTVTQSWPAVWEGILTLGALGLAFCGLGLIVVLAGSSFLTLRRAVP